MGNIFYNFEIIKLDIQSSNTINLLILILFILTIVITLRKHSDSISFLSPNHTEQLKGLAIFFVILGHMWWHVSLSKPAIILSYEAVSMFLILSGYGLTVSSGVTYPSLRTFINKRIYRVFIPYWLSTVIILVLDFIFRHKFLSYDKIIMTFLGINLNKELYCLDYIRWFITFILLWYVVFYLVISRIRIDRIFIPLILISFILLLLNYYIFHFEWYHFFSFPLGCFIAIYRQKIIQLFITKRKKFILFAFVGILYVFLYKVIVYFDAAQVFIYDTIPNIGIKLLIEGNSIIFNTCLIILFGFIAEKRLKSGMLILLGRYSYEMILLHGVFLIKYNPFFRTSSQLNIIGGFILLLIFVYGLSVILSKINSMFYFNKTT